MDRNVPWKNLVNGNRLSLSARRAWIEIPRWQQIDRYQASLSARRAWIEIDNLTDDVSTGGVALRKESVDRNHAADMS